MVDFAIVEPQRRAVLVMACECLDRIAEAREAIARGGAYLDGGRYGTKAHPGLAVARDWTRLAMTALAMLDLDLTAGNLVAPRSDRG